MSDCGRGDEFVYTPDWCKAVFIGDYEVQLELVVVLERYLHSLVRADYLHLTAEMLVEYVLLRFLYARHVRRLNVSRDGGVVSVDVEYRDNSAAAYRVLDFYRCADLLHVKKSKNLKKIFSC